ncbi:MAG TPA: SgcJ/EcaC family oxidoreductase [Terracidiphilus sp.]|jgi:uncharacterized protein (TIGR02246 family)
MKSLPVLVCVAALACGMSACNTAAPAAAPDTHDADVKAINDTEVQWNKDYEARDLDKIAAHYADDGVLMAPGGPAAKGTAAIRAGLQEMMKDPGLTLKFHATMTDVSKSGELGYTQGSYVMTVTNPMTHKPMKDHGSYVTTYRKQADGSWKAVADIATSEVPSMPMPEKKM